MSTGFGPTPPTVGTDTPVAVKGPAYDPAAEDRAAARPYVDAVWNAATEQNKTDELADELDGVANAMTGGGLDGLLAQMAADPAKQEQFVERVFKGRVGELTYRFLATLAKHRRLSLAEAAAAEVQDRRRAKSGKTPVEVTSAVELDQGQREAVTRRVAETWKIQPDVTFVVDAGVQGGLRVRVGDVVYDQTVRANLSRLRTTIVERSKHVLQSR